MNEIKIFENEQFGKIRTTGTPDEPLFCAMDVCKALGYANGRKALADRVDIKDVTKRNTLTKGGSQSLSYVNESGLYALIFGSKLESAREFKRWVTSEVLPSIRKHGGYIATTPDDTPELIMARALKIADATIKKRERELAAAREQLSIAEHTVEKQNQQLTEQKPKVEFYDAAMNTKDAKSLQVVAKTIGIPNVGRTIVFRILREKKILDSKNQPNQQYVNEGYFKLIQVVKPCRDRTRLFTQTVVFPRGIEFVRNVVLRYIAEQRNRDNGVQQLNLFDNI